jgi:hypothetical protein
MTERRVQRYAVTEKDGQLVAQYNKTPGQVPEDTILIAVLAMPEMPFDVEVAFYGMAHQNAVNYSTKNQAPLQAAIVAAYGMQQPKRTSK